MKAQGLPMTTIVLIILVIVVLVGVLLFFFTGFGEGGENVGEQNVFGACQAECLKVEMGGMICEEYEEDGSYTNKVGVNCSEYKQCADC